MITKVLIHRYLIVKQGNTSVETEVNVLDITDLLYDIDFVLNYRLEFGDLLEQIPSDIELKFDNDLIPGTNFTLLEHLVQTTNWYLQFAGISIYLDGNSTPEFWGGIDFSSLVYDEAEESITFNVYDFIKKYMEIWKEKLMPNVWNPYNDVTNLDDILSLIISNSSLLQTYNYSCGGLNGAKISVRALRDLYDSEKDEPYTIEEFLNILRRQFSAYIYINVTDKFGSLMNQLNFVSIKQAIEDGDFDDSLVISSQINTYPYSRYTACVGPWQYLDVLGNIWQPGLYYRVGDLVKFGKYIYRCIEEHEATDTILGYYWELVGRITGDIIYPEEFLTGTPYAVLLESNGDAYALPYYGEATMTDWGTPVYDIDELVKKYRPKHLDSYLNLIPDIRFPKYYDQYLEALRQTMLSYVNIQDVYSVVKQLIPDKYLEERTVEYDGYNFRLLQKVIHKDKPFIIVGISKNLKSETSVLTLREMYE